MLKVTDSMLANAAACPVRNVLDQVGSKWCLLVMLALHGRRRRFMDLKRAIGDITQRVLHPSIEMFASSITFAHFSRSTAMNSANS